MADKIKTFTVYPDKELAARVEKYAEKTGIPISRLFRRAIINYLAKLEGEGNGNGSAIREG